MSPSPRIVTDRDELEVLFAQDRAVHVYGLADLEDRFWDHSTWWRRGDAVVGKVRLPGPEGVVAVYAISPRAPEETIELLVKLSPSLPDGALVLGPIGAGDSLGRSRLVESFGTHVKMTVDAQMLAVPADVEQTTVLGPDDLSDLQGLYARDPGAAYFLPSMLDTGIFVGVRSGGRLVAAAGTHGLSTRYGVAALGGIITDPDARGRGHAGQVTAALSQIALDRGLTVGLNVKVANATAIGVYQRLGFREIHHYVEFEFTRPAA